MKRQAAMLPPPRKHLTTFHGVYGPNSKLRLLVARAPAQPTDSPTRESGTPPPAAAPKPKRPRLDWATLQARTFGEDVWRCPCGGRLRVLAVVSTHRTAEEVLQRLGLLQPRKLLPASHGPDPPPLSLPP